MAINLDKDKKSVLSFDSKENGINIQSECILNSVNSDIAASIKEHFKINLSAYGVEIENKVIEINI